MLTCHKDVIHIKVKTLQKVNRNNENWWYLQNVLSCSRPGPQGRLSQFYFLTAPSNENVCMHLVPGENNHFPTTMITSRAGETLKRCGAKILNVAQKLFQNLTKPKHKSGISEVSLVIIMRFLTRPTRRVYNHNPVLLTFDFRKKLPS